MKAPLFSLLATIFLATGAAPTAKAAVVIVDNTTNNGSFESGSGGVPDLWVAYGTNPTINRGTSSPAPSQLTHQGSYSLVVGVNSSSVNDTGALNTGYTIASGDTFSFSFWYNSGATWNPSYQINYSLFYTNDNTLTGTATALLSGSVTPTSPGSSSTWQQYVASSVAATVGSVGKTLFVAFTPGTGVTSNNFARVDEVALSVVAVPEPSVVGLAGLGLGALLLVRRRKRSFVV